MSNFYYFLLICSPVDSEASELFASATLIDRYLFFVGYCFVAKHHEEQSHGFFTSNQIKGLIVNDCIKVGNYKGAEATGV